MKTYSKKANEIRTFAVDFSLKMAAAELLTGTPTVVEATTTDLTISDIELNSVVRTVGGSVSPVDCAVLFIVAGGTAGSTYVIRITAATDEGQTLIEDVELRVN